MPGTLTVSLKVQRWNKKGPCTLEAQVEWKDTLIMQPSEDGIEEEGGGRVVQKTG